MPDVYKVTALKCIFANLQGLKDHIALEEMEEELEFKELIPKIRNWAAMRRMENAGDIEMPAADNVNHENGHEQGEWDENEWNGPPGFEGWENGGGMDQVEKGNPWTKGEYKGKPMGKSKGNGSVKGYNGYYGKGYTVYP